mgnify:CR=1 FL=1
MAKTYRWLYVNEAELIGKKPKKNEEGRKQSRYYISEDDYKIVLEHRLDKKLTTIGKSTLRDKKGNIVIEWTKTSKTQEDLLKSLRAAIDTLKEDVTPVKKIKRPQHFKNENLINQYTLTDYHLGMMSWSDETGADWDLKIAENTLVKFFETAIKISPNAKECIFAQIGDFLHWDGLDAVTPASKHVLDADTRFTKLVRVSIRVIRRVIEMLLNKYDKVNVIMAEGNHDPASSVWLRELLYSFYEKEPRLNIDTNPDPYYCLTFGKNCLFYHHGHKRNFKNIDNVFVGKFKKEFGVSDFVYGHTGHLHHELKKESNLMILEQHRTLAAKDAYASRGGYLSGRDSKVITYHKDYGEVGRNTISIDMLK